MIRGSRLPNRASRNNAKEKKRLKKLNRWPAYYDIKIDVLKLDKKSVLGWIESSVTAAMGFEDEVLVGTIQNSILDVEEIDPINVRNTLEPFLGEKTDMFMKDLWAVLSDSCATNESKGQVSSDAPPESFLSKYESQRLESNVGETRQPGTHSSTGMARTDECKSKDDERQSRRHKDTKRKRRRRSSSRSSESSSERINRRRRRRRRNTRSRSSSM